VVEEQLAGAHRSRENGPVESNVAISICDKRIGSVFKKIPEIAKKKTNLSHVSTALININLLKCVVF